MCGGRLGLEATKEEGEAFLVSGLGKDAQQMVLPLRWRLYRELYGRQGPSIVPRRGNYGARRLQVEKAEREVRQDAVLQLLPLFLLPG